MLPGLLIAMDRWQSEDKPKIKVAKTTDFTGMAMIGGLVIGGVIGFFPFNADANFRHALESGDGNKIYAAAIKWPTDMSRILYASKIFESNNFYFFNKKETKIILSEINNIINTCDFSNKKKFNIIEELFFGMTHNQILFEIMPNCKETLNYQSYIFEKIKKTLFYLDCYFTYITEKISQNNLNENNENRRHSTHNGVDHDGITLGYSAAEFD